MNLFRYLTEIRGEINMQENLTPIGEIIVGYKATDANMQCRGFKYELGKWYEHDGEIVPCKSGFHFCEHMPGPLCYYNQGRLFKCEAELVLKSYSPGVGRKHVAKRIRLIQEIAILERYTTGNGNSGDENTGRRNDGDNNTGHENFGNFNTGNENSGNRNTGNCNIGNRNSGNDNVGNGNTGNGNVGNYHSGCLNFGEAPFYIFNKPTKREYVDFELVYQLSRELRRDVDIDPSPYLSLPNANAKIIKVLHEAYKEARRKIENNS